MHTRLCLSLTAILATGNLYVADYFNNRIRMISPSGMVTTVIGNGVSAWNTGVGIYAQTGLPRYLTMDASGSLYAWLQPDEIPVGDR